MYMHVSRLSEATHSDQAVQQANAHCLLWDKMRRGPWLGTGATGAIVKGKVDCSEEWHSQ